uniref:Uncharacterized protein n=1 Tax=Caenorhabditis japonica TaxID=281687 RepID=A0A8R1ITP3_CAEJA
MLAIFGIFGIPFRFVPPCTPESLYPTKYMSSEGVKNGLMFEGRTGKGGSRRNAGNVRYRRLSQNESGN